VCEELARSRHRIQVLDWAGQYDLASCILIVAALDLSTAEVLLRLPPGARVVGILNPLESRSAPWSGKRRLLARASSIRCSWVPAARPVSTLPHRLVEYLEPALDLIAALDGDRRC
jgi:hypothetical protein